MSQSRPQAPPQRFLRRNALLLMLLVGAAARAIVAVAIPPESDVYYYLTQAVRTFIEGADPYLHTYTGLPSGLSTPGASHVFAYLPMTFLYLVPFSAIGGVRAGMIAADLIIGTCIFLYGGRWKVGATFIYIFLPFTVLFSTVYVNATLVAMALLAVFFVLESRGLGAEAAVFLGLAAATVQFCLLLVPLVLVYYYRAGRWKEPLVAAVTAALVILPFLLYSPSSFLNETLFFQFDRQVEPLVTQAAGLGFALNPSLDAFSIALAGVAVPGYVKLIPELVAIVALMRVRDLSSFARNSAFLVIVSAVVLPNDFFWSYLELPFMFLLFWLSAPRGIRFADGSPTPKT